MAKTCKVIEGYSSTFIIIICVALLCAALVGYKFFDNRPVFRVVLSPVELHFEYKCRLCGAKNEFKETINVSQHNNQQAEVQ